MYNNICCYGEHLSDKQEIAGLCNGSTADSDSVCEGSNPSPAAKASDESPGLFLLLLEKFSLFFLSRPKTRNCLVAALAPTEENVAVLLEKMVHSLLKSEKVEDLLASAK